MTSFDRLKLPNKNAQSAGSQICGTQLRCQRSINIIQKSRKLNKFCRLTVCKIKFLVTYHHSLFWYLVNAICVYVMVLYSQNLFLCLWLKTSAKSHTNNLAISWEWVVFVTVVIRYKQFGLRDEIWMGRQHWHEAIKTNCHHQPRDLARSRLLFSIG